MSKQLNKTGKKYSHGTYRCKRRPKSKKCLNKTPKS